MSHISASGYSIIEALAEKVPLLQGPATILAQPLRERGCGKGRRSSICNGGHGNCCPYGRRTALTSCTFALGACPRKCRKLGGPPAARSWNNSKIAALTPHCLTSNGRRL